MSNEDFFKDRGSFPAQRKELEDQIARQKRADVEAEIAEMKSDDEVESFAKFVRDQGVIADDLSDDDLSMFIRYGNLMGQGAGDSVRVPKETRLNKLRDTWEKGRKEKK